MVKNIIAGFVGAGFFALAFLGYQSHAEPVGYKALVTSVVRVEGHGGYGSGVIVDPSTILTAGHVGEGLENGGGTIETIDHRVFVVQAVFVSPTYDFAVLKLLDPIQGVSTSAKFTCDMPEEDTDLLAIGHPLGTSWSPFRFSVAGDITDPGAPPGGIVAQGASNPGLSGAPAFNRHGEVVGLITHSIAANNGEEGSFSSGLAIIMPLNALCLAEGDPAKEALGW